jgi:hypothetical protein
MNAPRNPTEDADAGRSMKRRASLPAACSGGALLLALLAGCGSGAATQAENYGNLLASPGLCSSSTSVVCDTDADCPSGEYCNGLIVLEQEHDTGWTRPDCFLCHNVNNIHQVNRTGLPDDEVDLANIRAIVRNQGEDACLLCHGDNGVGP